MRVCSFRDDVLWAIAYKMGLDPATNFLRNEAYAIASFINSWVRRLWDATDWPEWTVIGRFSVQTAPGLEHVVGWGQPPIEFIPPPDAPAPGATRPLIGKVLKVYLVDPRTTWTPVETPFRLEHVGIHCGFEHGNSVWIKFISRCPRFTATEWDAAARYGNGSLVYSPASGECYKSKSNNNVGHDPSEPGGGGPIEPPMVEEAPGTKDNVGTAEQTKIVDVFAGLSSPMTTPILIDPPTAGSIFKIAVRAADGVTVLGAASFTATGTETLEDVFTDLADQLTVALTGFTVTFIASPVSIRLEHASDFMVYAATFTAGDGPEYSLNVVQLQKYVPLTPPVIGASQQFKLSLNDDQVVPGATYVLTFTSVDSEEHQAIYMATPSDGATQVLSGLIDAIIALQPADPFFLCITSTLDTVSPSATFAVNKTTGMVSLDAAIAPPGATYWEIVPFPFVLVDQVVRGVLADTKGESGQTDKQQAEEQVVPTESTLRIAATTGKDYDPLTDQQRGHSRYGVK